MTIDRYTPLSDLPEWLRAEEAGAWLDCSKGAVYDMAKSGRLASVRLGKLLRIHRSALEALVERTNVA